MTEEVVMRRTLALLLFAGACSTTHGTAQQEPRQAAEAEAPPTEAEKVLTAAEQEQQYRREYAEVMYERSLTLARRERDRLELETALRHVENALRFRPQGKEALQMRAELWRMLGQRTGEVRTLMQDESDAQAARAQERVVEVRKRLAQAEALEAAGNLEEARRRYEEALFIIEVAAREGTADPALVDLAAQARIALGTAPQEE